MDTHRFLVELVAYFVPSLATRTSTVDDQQQQTFVANCTSCISSIGRGSYSLTPRQRKRLTVNRSFVISSGPKQM